MRFLLFLLMAVSGLGATVEWDANPETNVLGYRVYWGLASRTYTSSLTTSNTTVTITNLHTGTNFFAVTAFDDLGLESDYSDEVWLLVKPLKPVGVKLAPVVTVQSAPTVTGPWTNVVQIASGVFGSQFYRMTSAMPDPPEPAKVKALRFVSPKTGKL